MKRELKDNDSPTSQKKSPSLPPEQSASSIQIPQANTEHLEQDEQTVKTGEQESNQAVEDSNEPEEKETETKDDKQEEVSSSPPRLLINE